MNYCLMGISGATCYFDRFTINGKSYISNKTGNITYTYFKIGTLRTSFSFNDGVSASSKCGVSNEKADNCQ